MTRVLPLLVACFVLPGTIMAQTYVSGAVSGTWTVSGSPYIVLSPGVTITAPDSLIIDAGVVVRFEPAASLSATGDLQVNGTSGNTVVFQAATQPGSPGDWQGIELGGGTHALSYFEIMDAGTGIANGLSGSSNLTVNGASFSNTWTGVTHENTGSLTVGTSQFLGPGTGIGLAPAVGPGVSIQGNVFDGCTEAMTLAADSSPGLDGNTAVNCGLNGARVFAAGAIMGNAVWDDDNMPRVVWNDTISVGPTGSLTIEPGTIIKILNDSDPAGLDVSGTLTVNGTSTDPVVFTSLRDDSVAGDTNADGAASLPSPGDWDGITISGGTGAFTHARFGYAGTAVACGLSDPSDLTVADSSFTETWTGITHENTGTLSITNSGFHGPGTGIGLATGLGSQVTIQDNTFDGCAEAMTMAADSSPLLGGNIATGCAVNGTRIYGTGPITGTTTWDDDGMPLVLWNDVISVAPAGSLTVEAGAVIKSLNDFSSTGLDVSGSFAANGSFGSPVIFTSLLDDSVMGDTNGDGAATTPSPGDWDGITISTGSAALTRARLAYAATAIGNGLSGPSDLTVIDSTFTEVWSGVTHENTGDLTIEDSGFQGPGTGVALAAGLGPNVTVRNNTFDGCADAMTMAADSSPTLGGNTATNCALNGNRIYGTGPITGPATWDDDGMPLVLRNDTFSVGPAGSLTIEAGAVIKSLNETNSTGLDLSGTLTVSGTPAKPVVFTSLRDDSVLGDTNGDGAGSVPIPGDWDGLTISGGSGSVNGATFRYAGTAVANGLAGPSDLTVAGCRFEESWTGVTHEDTGNLAITGSRFYGPGLGVGLATGLGPNVTVQSNTFEGCSEAITMAADSNPVLGGNTAANCALNGTRIYSTGPILGAATWSGDGMPLVLWNETVTVGPAASLAIEAGAVVKSLNDLGSTALDVAGMLTVNGTGADPAILTSLLDDSVVGDTNADAGATLPAPGDWDGIILSGVSAGLTGADVRFATTGLTGAGSGALLVQDSTFSRCYTGVEAGGTTSGYAGGTVIVENGDGMVVGPASTFQLGDSSNPDPVQRGSNDIYCNGSTDVIFFGAGTLSAHNNWWGEAPPDLSEIQAIGGGGVDVSGFRSGPARDTVKLALMPAAPSGIELNWRNVATCLGYRIQRAGDPQFTVIDIDLPLSPGTASYIDATPPPDPILYYRVTSD